MADIGTGSSVTFVTSGFTADITNIAWDGITRVSVDTSHLLTTSFMTFIPGDLTDPGNLSLDIQFEPDDTPPFNGVIEVVRVDLPLETGQVTAARWEASGFQTDFAFVAPLEEVMTATMGIKFTGGITITPAA